MYNFTLPSKTHAEKKTVTFPFATEIPAGAVISSPVMAKALIEGDGDVAAATALIVGTPQVVGSDVLVLVVAGGTGANTYGLLCTVNDNAGEVHVLGARMTVTDDAA